MRRRFWPGWGAIRVQLTLAYVLVLALTLLLYSSALYLQIERSLRDQVDAGLRATAAQVYPQLLAESERPAFQTSAETQVLERRLRQTGVAVRLVTADG